MMKSSPEARRIGIIGGSFDPVHTGHLIIAQDAIDCLKLSEVVFIPAAIPPHKQHLQQVAPEHRLNMLKLAVDTDVRFSVSDIEIQRGGVSYTIDTVRCLREKYSDAELFLVAGSDTLVDLHNWYEIDDLLGMCEVASFLRPGDDVLEEIAGKIKLADGYVARLMSNLFDAHRIEISSTEVRLRLAEGRSVSYLVPSSVEKYIYEHGLYQG